MYDSTIVWAALVSPDSVPIVGIVVLTLFILGAITLFLERREP